MPKALRGDTRSLEVCRRLLDQMARANGMYGSAEPLVRDDVPVSDGDDDADVELTAWVDAASSPATRARDKPTTG